VPPDEARVAKVRQKYEAVGLKVRVRQ
jgi:hypothetical protein